MGVVHEAYDPQIDRTVALKVLRPDYCADESSVLRFLREARTIGRVSHPHIVTVYDVGEDRGTLYIAMEYVDGKPLSELIREQSLSREAVLDIGIQIAETLDHAHSRGVVHRDIKPSNILVQPNGRIKITDFGIAHMEDSACTLQTREGEILGTPAFMSPEQVQGKPVDGRSDLFSLGVVLYQLATGQRPFGERGSTLASLLHAIVNTSPVEPVELRPDLDPRLGKVIMKCLSKKPEERFPSGAALAQALRECRRREHGRSWGRLQLMLQRHGSSLGFAHAFLIAAFSLSAVLFYLFPKPSADGVGSQAADAGASMSAPNLRDPAPTPGDPAVADQNAGDLRATPLLLGAAHHSAQGGDEDLQTETMAARGSASPPLTPESRAVDPAPRVSVRERPPAAVLYAAVDSSAEPQVQGIVEVSSTPPGAQVLVDGIPLGVTPCVSRVPAGAHVLTVRSPDHEDWERQVSIEAGREYPFDIALQKAVETSVLAVVSEPARARIFVNGIERGLTPSTLKLPPGRHQLKIKHRRFKEFETQVVLARADEQSLKAKLTPVQPRTRRVERTQPPPPHPVSSLVSQVRYQLSPQTLWRRVRNLF